MLQFAAWVAICVVVTYLLRSRPLTIVAVAMALWILVPGVAGHLLTAQQDSSIALHPASWFLIAGFAMVLIGDPAAMGRELGRQFFVYLALTFVVVDAAVLTRIGTSPAGVTTVVDQILVPTLMFILANVAGAADPLTVPKMRSVLLVLASFESMVAIAQYATDSVLVYKSSYIGFDPAIWTRWMGTTDHPLTLALLLAVTSPLIAGMTRRWLQVPLLALFGVGIMITQSRTGMVAFAVAVIYVLLTAEMGRARRVLTAAAVVTAGIAAYLSPIAAGLLGRVADDTGSSAARGAAIDFFASHWSQFLTSGDGLTAGFTVAQNAGLATSFESSVLLYSVGIGILFTAVYFGTQLFLIARYTALTTGKAGGLSSKGVLLAGIFVLILPQTYSALAVDQLVGPLVWFVLAMTCAGAALARPPGVRSEVTPNQVLVKPQV